MCVEVDGWRMPRLHESYHRRRTTLTIQTGAFTVHLYRPSAFPLAEASPRRFRYIGGIVHSTRTPHSRRPSFHDFAVAYAQFLKGPWPPTGSVRYLSGCDLRWYDACNRRCAVPLRRDLVELVGICCLLCESDDAIDGAIANRQGDLRMYNDALSTHH